jgi:hypothetical protein
MSSCSSSVWKLRLGPSGGGKLVSTWRI